MSAVLPDEMALNTVQTTELDGNARLTLRGW